MNPDEIAEILRLNQRYDNRCRTVVESLASQLTHDDIAWLDELIDHNEGSLAMNHLAWKVVNKGLRVPRQVIATMRELAGPDDGADDHWPSNLDEFAIPRGEG